MSWAERVPGIGVGDRVCYRRAFLQSTGQCTGEAPFARGVVLEVVRLGEIEIARIQWDGDSDLPARVAVANLAKVTPQGIAEAP